jgi:hypothetical protein
MFLQAIFLKSMWAMWAMLAKKYKKADQDLPDSAPFFKRRRIRRIKALFSPNRFLTFAHSLRTHTQSLRKPTRLLSYFFIRGFDPVVVVVQNRLDFLCSLDFFIFQ